MIPAEKKARDLLASRTTEDLVKQFELTSKITTKVYTAEIPIVRGWIMDELEKRDAKAFDKWIDSLHDSPRAFYLK